MPKKYILALDIGGTKINAGLISQSGKIIFRARAETQAKKPKIIILKNIFDIITDLLFKAKNKKIKVLAVGIGLAGQIDFEKGIFIAGPNFSRNFKNIPLKNILEKKYRLPIFIDNDARCFALGESIFGQGKNYKNIIGLTLGTGIGGGIIIDKKVYRGNNNLAGEFGHMTMNLNGPKCSCGKPGHFEALASGRAISQMYKKLAHRTAKVQQIEEKLKQGEKTAKIIIQRVSQNLAIGLANLISALNPEIIILGGGLIKFKKFWQPAIKMIKEKNPFSFNLKTKVIASKLGDDATLLGAAALTRRLP
jgi:glucokinase